jgi:hypothetical protein
MTKPSFYVCGGGGNIDCEFWDDINGCWRDETIAEACSVFIGTDRQREIDDEGSDE